VIRPRPAFSALSCALALGLSGACTSAESAANRHAESAANQHAERPDRFYERLSAEDLKLVSVTLQRSLETKASSDRLDWRNPQSGNGGAFVPLRTFKIRNGYFCREYREDLVADKAAATRQVTACRRKDGRWIPALR
jgi:surface antigen